MGKYAEMPETMQHFPVWEATIGGFLQDDVSDSYRSMQNREIDTVDFLIIYAFSVTASFSNFLFGNFVRISC